MEVVEGASFNNVEHVNAMGSTNIASKINDGLHFPFFQTSNVYMP